MILSHAHRFIFLKTKKTAGTSVELALSEICGPDDVVTRNLPKDYRTGRGRPPRNERVPDHLRPFDWRLRRLIGQDDRRAGLVYYNHMTAAQVKRTIDPKVWRSYRKVTIERNPWDREVSYYFWQNKHEETRPSFEDYVMRLRRFPVNNFEIYSIRGRVVADLVLRYEHLEEDFARFVGELGVPDPPSLPAAKGAFRPSEARNYRTFYNDRTRAEVARLYAREIALFGYEF